MNLCELNSKRCRWLKLNFSKFSKFFKDIFVNIFVNMSGLHRMNRRNSREPNCWLDLFLAEVATILRVISMRCQCDRHAQTRMMSRGEEPTATVFKWAAPIVACLRSAQQIKSATAPGVASLTDRTVSKTKHLHQLTDRHRLRRKWKHFLYKIIFN